MVPKNSALEIEGKKRLGIIKCFKYTSYTIHKKAYQVFVIVFDELLAHLQIQSTQVVLKSHFVVVVCFIFICLHEVLFCCYSALLKPFINSSQILCTIMKRIFALLYDAVEKE